ncbi:EFR1 family ferrodoxin [Anaerofustis stercorihominis]|uniref:4Fe-4S dicluster domain-containing protein n=1 Tax=Anaerofustis stercorihominis TaxID=214853 RepID=A0A3E3DX72_9FIRM|nr:EFR1 family ferrodoxin [Anaerofustis stercorihominis]RGD73881.1 4Fe-4S dicluster domain-containing protein [Anaerofustis stercorihominis]
MIGIYFSGTGNTKYCIDKFVKNIESDAKILSLESENIKEELLNNKDIVFAYPIYYSSLPKIVRDFILNNKDLFKNKNVFIIATMGLFSGDSTRCSARILKKCGANIMGGLHVKMPDCIADVKALKRSKEENKQIILKAESKIMNAAEKYKNNAPTKEGLSIIYHIAGLVGQRLWFYNKTKEYSSKLKVDNNKCIKCKRCISLCPMNNLKVIDNKINTKNKCTMCYRCITNCPAKAITLLGKNVIEQNNINNYIN